MIYLLLINIPNIGWFKGYYIYPHPHTTTRHLLPPPTPHHHSQTVWAKFFLTSGALQWPACTGLTNAERVKLRHEHCLFKLGDSWMYWKHITKSVTPGCAITSGNIRRVRALKVIRRTIYNWCENSRRPARNAKDLPAAFFILEAGESNRTFHRCIQCITVRLTSWIAKLINIGHQLNIPVSDDSKRLKFLVYWTL